MCSPWPRLAAVLEELGEKSIQVMEYGDILNARFGYPVCVTTLRWCVPDSQISEASNVLLEHNVPILPQVKSDDEWDQAGAMHTYAATRVHVLPLSLTGLSLDDCVEEVSSLDAHQKILIPKERQYLVSLIRMLLPIPMCRRRYRVSIDLMVFLEYRVFPRLSDDEDEENESEEHFQLRVGQALSRVRQWDWKSEEQKFLRYSEDIIRDCNLIESLKE